MKNKFIISFLSISLITELVSQNPTNFAELKIGKQIWTDKNLNVTKFRNGDPILLAQSEEEWRIASNSKLPAYCYYSFESEIKELEKKKKSILDAEKNYTISQKFNFEKDSILNDLKNQVNELIKKSGKSKKNNIKIDEINTKINEINVERDLSLAEWKKTVDDESGKIKSELDEINTKIEELNNIESELGKGSKYGYLYNFYAISDPRGLAPEGWMVPTVGDWDDLEKFIGKDPAVSLKSISGWYEKKSNGKEYVGNGNNVSKFNALPGGWRSQFNSKFLNLNDFAYFWTSEKVSSSNSAYARGLDCTKNDIWKDTNALAGGLSVRLIKSKEKLKK
jgi:uncharacterized protein (TIGR02145 family)